MDEENALCRQTLSELARQLQKGAVSAEEITDAHLARINERNGVLNAIICVDEAGARRAARESDRRRREGVSSSPLDGVPLTIKDNIYVRELPSTWGSRLFAEFVPHHDDIAVERIRRAGGVILGKTNTPEFSLSGYTDNLLFGTTTNPWNTEYTPGGSSGGAAAAVAAGLCVWGLATDGGGSIRRPASYTGLVGIKPSTGRVPRCQGPPPLLLDFQSIGVLARSVVDAVTVMTTIAGPDKRDRGSFALPRPGQGPRVSSQRIGLIGRLDGLELDPMIDKTLAGAADVFENLGDIVEPVTPPYDPAEVNVWFETLSSVGVYRVVAEHENWPLRVTEAMAKLAQRGSETPASDYLRAIDETAEFRRKIDRFFEKFDLLLTPTSASHPWRLGSSYPQTIGGRTAGPRDAAAYTTFAKQPQKLSPMPPIFTTFLNFHQ